MQWYCSAHLLNADGSRVLQFAGGKRVAQEHGNRQRADASRNGRNGRGDLPDSREIDVADELAVDAIDANIDDDSTDLDHVGGDQPRLPDGSDQNVRFARNASEIFALRMADGHRRVGVLASQSDIALNKHIRHRLSDDIASSHNHNMLPRGFDLIAREDLQDTVRRAG